MDKSVKITLIIVGAIFALVLIGIFSFYSLFGTMIPGQTINVEGNSNLKVSPDVVSIYFNVETTGSTTQEANIANSAIVDGMVFALQKLDFDRKAVETISYNIYEDIRWENGKSKSYGYKATQQLRIVMNTSSASKIGDVIDAGVNAGAMLSYINFELSTARQSEYKTLALKQAGQDAKTKAEAIAEGLGKRLGGIVSISTSEFRYQPWNLYTSSYGGVAMDAAQAKEATSNIQPGNQDVSAYLSVVYKLR